MPDVVVKEVKPDGSVEDKSTAPVPKRKASEWLTPAQIQDAIKAKQVKPGVTPTTDPP